MIPRWGKSYEEALMILEFLPPQGVLLKVRTLFRTLLLRSSPRRRKTF